MSDATAMLRKLYAKRVAQGVCRHCGGRVPCWSENGDRAPGKKHTDASWRRAGQA